MPGEAGGARRGPLAATARDSGQREREKRVRETPFCFVLFLLLLLHLLHFSSFVLNSHAQHAAPARATHFSLASASHSFLSVSVSSVAPLFPRLEFQTHFIESVVVAVVAAFPSFSANQNNAPPRSSAAGDAVPAGGRGLDLLSRCSGRGGVDKFRFLVSQLRVDLHRRSFHGGCLANFDDDDLPLFFVFFFSVLREHSELCRRRRGADRERGRDGLAQESARQEGRRGDPRAESDRGKRSW